MLAARADLCCPCALISLQTGRIIIHKINSGLSVSLFLLLTDVLHKVDLGPGGALVATGQRDSPDLVALLDYLIKALVVIIHPY